MLAITATQFLNSFPEFAETDEPVVQAMIDQTLVETNSYAGLCNPAQQLQAVVLHVAHNLSMQNQQAQYGTAMGVKRYESRHDVIEFQNAPSGANPLSLTQYGQRLLNLLKQLSLVATYV